MTLKQPTEQFISEILQKYSKIEGDALNIKLQKLFDVFNDDTDRNEVLIKVAALPYRSVSSPTDTSELFIFNS